MRLSGDKLLRMTRQTTRKALFDFCCLCLCSSLCGFESSAYQRHDYITVNAGDQDRRECIVSFTLPGGLTAKAYQLRDDAGHAVDLQIDSDRQAWFVLDQLKAGASKRFKLEELKFNARADGDGVQLVNTGDKLAFSIAGKPVLTYQAKPGEFPEAGIKEIFRRGGYIHPVYTPSGRLVTDDYPPDHRHHHGIWFAWTKTEFDRRHPDFWNVGDGTGKVDFVAVDSTWNGPVQAGFVARHRYVDVSAPKPVTVLNEQWKVNVYRAGQGARRYAMFDVIATHECATSLPLVLPEYRYGGIGFRGHRDWLPKDNCVFLTSEGKDRESGHATRARWCHIGGKVGGELA